MARRGYYTVCDTLLHSESAAITVCKLLMAEGARINIYDPKVSKEQMMLDLTEPGVLSSVEQCMAVRGMSPPLPCQTFIFTFETTQSTP